MLNLDTHILLDAIDDELSAAEVRMLERDTWCVSAIVLWEIEMLARAGRIEVDLSHPYVQEALAQIQIMPIDSTVARAIRRLDVRSDPADELIAATSIALGFPLVTRDRNLQSSKVIPLIRT